MIKKLLSASLFAFVALAANAYEIGEFAYTKVAKYQITGANLVVNGQFKDGETGFASGWKATHADSPLESVFTMVPGGGPNGSNTQKVLDGQTALTNGMYQKIAIEQGGTYVVSFQVLGTSVGFTDLDLTGGNTNYMTAYYNTDEKDSLATVDGTNLYYGTDGVNGGYGFSFGTEGFTEAVFAVDAPANGYIIIDFRGLNAGMEIANVECHLAEAVYDDRVARDRIAYFQKYLVSEGINERELYADFMDAVASVEEGLANNASPQEMEELMVNLELYWEEFAAVNFENVLDLLPTKDGTANTGNNSANWMKWTGKWNKLDSEYKGGAPWSWSSNRWCHKTAAENNPMCLDWQRGNANDAWNNIATLTATLSKGKYYWGVTGQGGMKTLNKNRWARSWANECAETKLFFNGDTILVGTLNAARNQDYVLEFELAEDKEVTLGIICNNKSQFEKAGFDVHFFSPVLYKLIVLGDLTEAQKAYIAAFLTQMEALKGRIDAANAYVSAANDSLPWGKELLKAGAEEAQARYNEWALLDTTAILEIMDTEETKLSDKVMDEGVRFLNNNYITPFEAMNKPFTDMPGAIAAAEETLGVRMYSSSSKKTDLEASIAASKAMYAEKLQAPFSTEDSLALIAQRESMAAMVEAFKAAIDAKTFVDINFDGATIETHEDPEGLVETYYTLNGAKGTMTLSNYAAGATGTTMFELGVNGTDSLNMLRVGNGEASVDITGVPVTDQDIVKIQFDYFFGKFTGKDAGYKILTAEGDTIGGLFYCAYDGNVNADRGFDTYGIKPSVIPAVGASNASNAAIAAESNKTTFEVVLDYGLKTMYCVTTSSKGTFTSEAIALNGAIPAKFVVYSSYTNADRRCWIDNILVQNIATDPDGIEAIQIAKPVANGIMYNIMGQQILKPIKGQIYIQDGVKKIGK